MNRVIQVMLRSNVNAFRTDMVQAGAVVRAFGAQVDDVDRKTSGMGRNITFGKVLAGAAAVAVAGLIAATGASIEFDRNMRNVNSISNLSEGALRSLGGEVIKLSTRLPQSAKELSAGLYDIASSGFQGADGLKVLNASAEAASAGLSTTATAGKAITAVLNAYGLGANEATRVSDALFSTVNLGVVSFDELAGSIGDYVGMAAAAKVPIEEVGAAIATMTLAGISANEAGTSLSRVIQAIVDPSESLAAVLKTLGYETGAQALETDGLYKVMGKLREATGGQLTSLLQLFPEIRAARGALALMSAEGMNYTKVFEAMGDTTKNTGATKRALAEQMKGLGMQLEILRNKGMAWVTTLGMNTIPVVLKLINAMNDPRMKDSQIGRMFADLMSIGGNVVQVLGHLASAAAPVVVALLKIAAVPIVATLRLVASALESATSFLANHRGLVVALAGAYVATLIPGLASAAISFGHIAAAQARIVVGGTVIWIKSMAAGFQAASLAAGGYSTALLGVAAASLRIAAVAGIFLVADAWMRAGQKADDYIAIVKKGFDTSGTLDAYRSNLRLLEQEYNQAANAARNHKNETSFLNDVFRGGLVDQLDNIKLAKQLREEHETLKEAFKNTAANYKLIAQEAGISVPAVEAFNMKIGADFTTSVESSAGTRRQFIDTISEMAKQAGVTKEELVAMTNDPRIDPAKLTAAFKAMEEAGNATNESFRKATDVVSAFGNETSVTMAKIQKFYSDQIRQAQAFAGNVQKAMQAGLDPSVIQRALQAGPQAAAAFIEAVVQGNVATNVKILNEGEKTLSAVDQQLRTLAQQNSAAASGLADLGQTTVTPTVTLNDAQFRQNRDLARIDLGLLNSQVADPDLTANPTDLNEKVNLARIDLGLLDSQAPEPDFRANPADLDAKTRLALIDLGILDKQAPEPDLRANPNDLDAKIRSGRGQLSDLDRQAPEPDLRANPNDLNAKVGNAFRQLGDYGRQSPTASLGARDNASGVIDRVRGGLNSIAGRVFTATLRVVLAKLGFAEGGILPGQLTHHAEGSHDPQIARGHTRVWNEPETGGEAYIPLAPAKRRQSTALLGTVAGLFGYDLVATDPKVIMLANGGYQRPYSQQWANARAVTGGAMGSPQQLAALVASMKGGDTINYNITVPVKAWMDFRNKDVATRQITVAVRDAIRELERSER